MRILLTLFLAVFPLLSASFAQSSLQSQLQEEERKREQQSQPLAQAISRGEKFAAQGETLRAWEGLDQAWQKTPGPLRETPLGVRARKTLSLWEAVLAEGEVGQSDWPEARKWALRSLQHDPGNNSAQATLQNANSILQRGAVAGEEVNPALGSRFFEKLQGVQDGLALAEQLRETGQLDLAETKFEEVLRLDPFNSVATQGIQKIYEERALVSEQSRDLSSLERRREVRESWNNIYPKKAGQQGGTQVTGPLTASPSFKIEQKLKNIRVPIKFTGASLEEVRRALDALSQQYDTDAARKGVTFNISPDLISSPVQPINLQLTDVSLADAVKYVSQIAGVKAKIKEDGVTFSPVVETRPDLILREFTVSSSFFGESSSEETLPIPKGGEKSDSGSKSSGRSHQEKLMELGVVFPPGAFAFYNPNTSRLRVFNNAEMLDLIGQLIGAAEEETLLIQVGVRLVEINQSDLDSITVNSTLGGSGANFLSPFPVGVSTNNTGLTPAASTQQGVTAQLNQIQGVGLLPNNTLQSFLQQGVLAGTNQTSSFALNTMELGGTILNGMQSRTLITAVSQKSSANVLANPSIVLQRGQNGNISVTQEFRYVKEYNDPQSSIATIFPPNTPVGGAGIVESVPGPETVISSFPSSPSDPVNIGVEMGVRPDITGDNTRVSLKLEPSFLDFEGFINYGAVINSAYTARYFGEAIPILTNNILQPVFVRRVLEIPDIEVSDGYTLMLGGLLREDIQKIDEKVPLIGDLPLVGRAFQGKTEQAIKKNTLIFVTPRILQVDGQPLNPTAGSAETASAAVSP